MKRILSLLAALAVLFTANTPSLAADPLYISGFLPQPDENQSEHIFLSNISSTNISIAPYSLWDMQGHLYSSIGSIAPSSTREIQLSTAKLNNSGDCIFLRNGEEIVDSVCYGDAVTSTARYSVVSEVVKGQAITIPPPVEAVSAYVDQCEYLTEEHTSNFVRLTEVGVGIEPFIELENTHSMDISISDWQLIIGERAMPLLGMAKAGTRIVISQPPLSLGPGDHHVTLTNADDYIVQTTTITLPDNPKEPPAGAYITVATEEDMVFTELATPGTDNIWKIIDTIVEERVVTTTVIQERIVYRNQQQEDPPTVTVDDDTDVINTGVTITEILPNPVGPDAGNEYIELFNTHDTTVTLTGWSFVDASGNDIQLSSTTINPTSYTVIYIESTKLTLNNDGDTIQLLNPQGDIVSHITYTSATEGQSWQKMQSGDWDWQKATPSSPPPIEEEVIVVATAPEHAVGSGETSTETAEDSSTPPVITSLVISEVHPNPQTGEEEFIELYNPSIEAQVGTIIIDDIPGGSAAYTSSSIVVPGFSYLSLTQSQTGVLLNNSGDTIVLKNGHDELLDMVEIPELSKGVSFARGIDNEWYETTAITPGKENSITVVSNGTKDDIELEEKVTQTTTAKALMLIEEIENADKGDDVYTKAVVIAQPGVIGTQYFHVMDTTSRYVTTVYNQQKDFPLIEVGDEILISGVVSDTASGKRINISESQDIVVTKKGQNVTPSSELGQTGLVRVQGTVLKERSQELEVDVAGTTVLVRARKDAVILDDSTLEGEVIEITGIYTYKNDQHSIYLRSADDIHMIEAQTSEEQITSTDKGIIPPSSGDHILPEGLNNGFSFSAEHIISLVFIFLSVVGAIVRKNWEPIMTRMKKIIEDKQLSRAKSLGTSS